MPLLLSLGRAEQNITSRTHSTTLRLLNSLWTCLYEHSYLQTLLINIDPQNVKQINDPISENIQINILFGVL